MSLNTESGQKIKKEIEAMAVSSVACPSCKAAPGELCHYIGHGGGLCRIRKVKTHQRQLSRFVAENMKSRGQTGSETSK